MQGLGQGLIVEIVAALVILVIGGLLTEVLRVPIINRRRRELFRFFGITEDKQRFLVYLSTLFVRANGSADFRGNRRSFHAPAIPASELTTIQPISQLFGAPFLLSLPSSVRRWLGDKVHWTYRQLLPEFSFSPPDRSQVEPTNTLTVGSQYYNSAGDLYAETGNPFLKMEQVGTDMIIRVRKGKRDGEEFRPRPNQRDDLAIVERLFDQVHKTSVFIAAGLGEAGTLGAVHYLVDNWRQLHKDFGTEPFAVCLGFHDVGLDPYAHKKPVELSRFQ